MASMEPNEQQDSTIGKGTIQWREEKKSKKGKPFLRLKIEGDWYSLWDPKLFPRALKGAHVEFEYSEEGDFCTIKDLTTIADEPEKVAQPNGMVAPPGRPPWKDTSPSIERQKALAEARQTMADWTGSQGLPMPPVPLPMDYGQHVLMLADVYDAWLARGREPATTPVAAPTSPAEKVSEAEVAQEQAEPQPAPTGPPGVGKADLPAKSVQQQLLEWAQRKHPVKPAAWLMQQLGDAYNGGQALKSLEDVSTEQLQEYLDWTQDKVVPA